MSALRGPTGALTLVRVAARLVPASQRPDWLREWQAELLFRWDAQRRQGSLGALRRRLTRVALGSFIDAARLRAKQPVLRGFVSEIRIAVRSLARRPLFAGLVVATLAIGIGANATLYGVARDQLLKPFPYPDADQVVAILSRDRDRSGFSGNTSYPNMADVDETSTMLQSVGAIRYWNPALTNDAGASVLNGATVTANFFRILGVEAGEGRFFASDEEGTGREPRIVLSHGFWKARYGGDPLLVGRDVMLNGSSYQVIGITQPDFEDPWLLDGPGSEPQVWRTVASPPSEWPRSGRSWKGVGRVRSGVSREAAQAEVSALMASLELEYPDHNAGRMLQLVPLRERIAGPVRPAILILLGSVGMLLLVATANLAGLLLGRALDRGREFAVLRALGASGWRIVRTGLTESAILSLAGGALGLGLTTVLARLVQRLSGAFLPRPISVGLDPSVVLFATAVTITAGLFFGLVPAFHAARAQAGVPGREEGRGATRGRSGNRLRRGLVIVQIGITTVLLVGSGLLIRSFDRLGRVELGMETEGVLAVELHGSAWWELDTAEAQSQWDAVLEAVRNDNQIGAVGAIDYVPLDGSYSCDGVRRDDRPPPPAGEGRCAEVRSILPGALEVLGVPLVAGRRLSSADGVDGPLTAVVDESLAATMWPAEDPLGKPVVVHGNVHEIVGVVGDMKHFGPGQTARPMLFLPGPQDGWNGITRGLSLIIRSDAPTDRLVPAVRAAIQSVNPAIALGTVATLEGLLKRSLSAPRFRALLLTIFATAGLLLALLGVGGVMTFSVARRTRELGVRLALGARPEEVRRLVLREGMGLMVMGLVVGVVVALGIGWTTESLLFEVSSRDPLTYTGAITLVAIFGLACCYLPATRASKVDPVAALSADT